VLASIKACSERINLVGAFKVVLLNVVWNPSVERQDIYIYIYPVQIYMLVRKKLCTSAISLPPGQMKGRNTIDKLRRTLLSVLFFGWEW
jgi:DNA repair and recombination RAD54-like protein